MFQKVINELGNYLMIIFVKKSGRSVLIFINWLYYIKHFHILIFVFIYKSIYYLVILKLFKSILFLQVIYEYIEGRFSFILF